MIESSPLTAQLTYQFRPIQKIETMAGVKIKDERPALTEDDYDFVVFGGNDESNLVGSEVRKWLALVLLPALRDAEGDIQSWRKSPLRPLLERVRKQIPAVRELLTASTTRNAWLACVPSAPTKKISPWSLRPGWGA